LPGTRIATPLGWRTVERLRPSDQVMSASGPLVVLDMGQGELGPPLQAVRVPASCLGNREEAILLPDQGVLGDDPAGMAVCLGELPGHFGILRLSLSRRTKLVRLDLDRPAALCVAHGLWVAACGFPGSGTGAAGAGPFALLTGLAERVGRALREAGKPPPPTLWPGAG
jgi:hypothetical protein